MQPDGYTVSSLDELGEGYGFRKIRAPLGITAFGANAVVLPPGFASHKHLHDEQEELYFVHSGSVVFTLDGAEHLIEAGGMVRVAPATVRGFRNPSETEDAVYLAIGGKDGYVGRDAHVVE
ncbi:MAG: hypothetical protein QOE31_1965 [Solirubrobacteraceae bacterium]|nr:hypothetical protein [Solirubrobacteraceae bacterium]